ncbi:MAG TPA: CHAD domain-containing protein, partial [Methylotenera sp.]|nr:CHAD domain-containing protein [Methylotenera sp.]
LLNSENTDVLKSELGWLSGILGEARDLDVFITQTIPPIIVQFENHTGLLNLHQKAELAKAETYKSVREALSSQRYQCFLLMLGAWLENESWCGSIHDSNKVKVLDIANAMLKKRHRQLRQSGKGITKMHAEERHVIRIAAKKLRYAAEFFASLYSSKKSTAYVRSLSQLQDCLGVLNDITTTEKLVQKLIGSRPNRMINEATYICAGWNAYHATSSLEHLEGIWRTFTSQKKFWA